MTDRRIEPQEKICQDLVVRFKKCFHLGIRRVDWIQGPEEQMNKLRTFEYR